MATQPRGRLRCADGVALSRVVVPDRRACTDVADASWLEHLWNHENMFETGVVRANKC